MVMSTYCMHMHHTVHAHHACIYTYNMHGATLMNYHIAENLERFKVRDFDRNLAKFAKSLLHEMFSPEKV